MVENTTLSVTLSRANIFSENVINVFKIAADSVVFERRYPKATVTLTCPVDPTVKHEPACIPQINATVEMLL